MRFGLFFIVPCVLHVGCSARQREPIVSLHTWDTESKATISGCRLEIHVQEFEDHYEVHMKLQGHPIAPDPDARMQAWLLTSDGRALPRMKQSDDTYLLDWNGGAVSRTAYHTFMFERPSDPKTLLAFVLKFGEEMRLLPLTVSDS